MILTTVTGGPFTVNCYIAASEKTKNGIIIDPGAGIDTIMNVIETDGIHIGKIICTHGHIDHTAGVKELQNRLSAPFFINEGDMFLLNRIPESAEMFGMKTEGIPRVDGWLQDGGAVSFDDVSLRVIHTPGHSPGGISLAGKREVFTGDTLFAGSVGRTDLPGGDFQQLIHSIKAKLFMLDDAMTVYCGHGQPTTIGEEKRFNPFLTEFL